MEREADVSGILGQTVEMLGAAGRAVITYVVVLGLFNGAGGLFGLASADDNIFSARFTDTMWETQTSSALEALFGVCSMVLFVIASYVLLTQMMAATGRPMRNGARFWSFVGMSILAMIGVMIGFLFLVIPGIVVLVRWSAANGFVLTGEHGITGSLGASWEATDGHGLSIFGAGLVVWIALAVLSSVVLGVAFAGVGSGGGTFSPLLGLATAISGFTEAFGNAVSFAFSIAVFHLVAPADTSVAEVFE